MVGAKRGSIHAANDGGAGWCANRCSRNGVLVEKRRLRKCVQIGSVCVGVSIAAEMRTMVLGREPENIRAVESQKREQPAKGDQDGQEVGSNSIHDEEERGRIWRFHNRCYE